VQLQDWPTWLLVGSIALLVASLLLKAVAASGPARSRAPAPPRPGADATPTIGDYRLGVFSGAPRLDGGA
jgi:hypothetical protein